MATKKKLNNFFLKFCTFSKVVLFFMLVLSLQLIFGSTSYAYMSSDYFNYGINTLKENFVGSTSNETSIFTNIISKVESDLSFKQSLVEDINNALDSYNIGNVHERCIFCFARVNNNVVILTFMVCNNGAPGTIQDLDHFCFYQYNSNYRIIPSSQTTTDFLYQFNLTIGVTNNVLYSSIQKWKFDKTSYATIKLGDFQFSGDNNSLLISSNCFAYGIPTGFSFYPLNQTTTKIPVILLDKNGNYRVPEPMPTPSGDTPSNNNLGNITTPSGDNGGNINLQLIQQELGNINNSVNNVQNQISGDTQKIVNTLTDVPNLSGETITSNQITENINFSPINNNSTLNGYTNFWFNLTTGLGSALNDSVRTIDIEFRNKLYTINLDDFSIQLPQQLKFLLTLTSTIYFVFIVVKWWKIIIDKITSGNIDEVLALNEEERHSRFILGGCFNA